MRSTYTALSLRLRSLLSFGFASLIGLAVLASVVGWLAHRDLVAKMDELLKIHARIATLSLQANSSMLEARRREKDYLLRYKQLGFVQARAKYASQVITHVEELRTRIAEIQSLANDETVKSDSATIDQAAEVYESTFLVVVDLIERRGYLNDGIEGEFRKNAHTIERSILDEHDDKLETDILTIRRHEKDYLLRGDPIYVERVRKAVEQLNEHVAATNRSADEKKKLVALSGNYYERFLELVQISNSVSSGISTYRDAVHKI